MKNVLFFIYLFLKFAIIPSSIFCLHILYGSLVTIKVLLLHNLIRNEIFKKVFCFISY